MRKIIRLFSEFTSSSVQVFGIAISALAISKIAVDYADFSISTMFAYIFDKLDALLRLVFFWFEPIIFWLVAVIVAFFKIDVEIDAHWRMLLIILLVTPISGLRLLILAAVRQLDEAALDQELKSLEEEKSLFAVRLRELKKITPEGRSQKEILRTDKDISRLNKMVADINHEIRLKGQELQRAKKWNESTFASGYIAILRLGALMFVTLALVAIYAITNTTFEGPVLSVLLAWSGAAIVFAFYAFVDGRGGAMLFVLFLFVFLLTVGLHSVSQEALTAVIGSTLMVLGAAIYIYFDSEEADNSNEICRAVMGAFLGAAGIVITNSIASAAGL